MGCELVREMLKSFARLFKGGAVKGACPCRAQQSAKALRGALFLLAFSLRLFRQRKSG